MNRRPKEDEPAAIVADGRRRAQAALSAEVKAGVRHSKATIRLLEGERSEMEELQRVFEEAPTYFQLVTGVPPGPAEAQSEYTVLPEGKTYDDKFVFGIYQGSTMVGCADLIRGHPTSRTAYFGLLLISEQHQRRGIGRAAFSLIEDVVRGWGTCDQIRLAVVRTNASVIPFWERLGFEATGEVRPYRYGSRHL